MAGLFDAFQDPQQMGLLAAAAQMLQASGPSRTPTSFGQVLGGGLLAGMQGMQQAEQNAYMRDYRKSQAEQNAMQSKLYGMKIQEAEREQEQAKKLQEAYQSFGAPNISSVMSAPGRVGPTPERAELIQQQPDMSNPYKRNIALAQHLESKGLPDQAYKLYELAEKHRPKVKNWQEVKQGDQVLYAPFFEDGTAGQPIPLEVARKMEFRDFGGTVGGVDPYTGKVGFSQNKTQSPDSIASNAVTMRGQNMVDARARQQFDLQRQEMLGGAKAPAGYRWNASGGLEAIPGGPADKQQVATEGERKAATLLQRLEGSQAQMNAALKEKPSAATPGFVANGLRAVGADAIANSWATSSPRQRVEASQLDILDAALTLGTGAAYTREQLEGYRKSYFPQVGDSEETKRDKEVRLNNLISAARTSAGRAAPPAGAKPVGGATTAKFLGFE